MESTVSGEHVGLVFPGQGAQYVGMGAWLANVSSAAAEVFKQADEALGFRLSKLCWEGPDEALDLAPNAQPAVVTMSAALLAALRERLGESVRPLVLAGHSLGHYSALVAADSLQLGDALRLVRERGRLMQEAGQRFPGGMAAIIGLSREKIEALCQEVRNQGPQHFVALANDNAPGQAVISGSLLGLQQAIERAQAWGARHVLPLKVDVAAHSLLMKEAAAQFATLVQHLPLRDPIVPVVDNITGQLLHTAQDIRKGLSEHIYHPVQWSHSITNMIDHGVKKFIEVGPGHILSRLISRISKGVETQSLDQSQLWQEEGASS